MGFGILWGLLSPLLVAAIKTLLPWLIERITEDLKAGRQTVIEPSEIRYQMQVRKSAIRSVYQEQER